VTGSAVTDRREVTCSSHSFSGVTEAITASTDAGVPITDMDLSFQIKPTKRKGEEEVAAPIKKVKTAEGEMVAVGELFVGNLSWDVVQ
jgi:hypothetical protein